MLEPSEERFRGLVTQMMWRMREGGGTDAKYCIGVTDDGVPVGLAPKQVRCISPPFGGLRRSMLLQMRQSLETLRRMAEAAGAEVVSIKIKAAVDDESAQVAEVCVRRPLLGAQAAMTVPEVGYSSVCGCTCVQCGCALRCRCAWRCWGAPAPASQPGSHPPRVVRLTRGYSMRAAT